MLESINNHWNEILSLIGAAAWIPIIFTPIIRHFDKIYVTVLDTHFLTDGVVSNGKGDKRKGTIVLFAMNLYIKYTDYFVQDIAAEFKLKSGALLNSKVLDFSSLLNKHDDGTLFVYDIPLGQELNVYRTINKGCDNIKYIALLVENANFDKIEDIKEIKFTFSHGMTHKKISIKESDFPYFNLIRKFENLERIKK